MSKILRILAFAGALAAGVICIVIAISARAPAFYAWAVVAFFGGITGFIFGTGGHPTGGISPPKLGGKFTGLPDWVVVADLILAVIALILSFIL